MTNTAVVVIAEADMRHKPGITRCYRLEPPKAFRDGLVAEYAVVSVIEGSDGAQPQVMVTPSDEYGAAVERSVMRRVGSVTLDGNPDTPEYLEGAFWLGLQLLGDYQA